MVAKEYLGHLLVGRASQCWSINSYVKEERLSLTSLGRINPYPAWDRTVSIPMLFWGHQKHEWPSVLNFVCSLSSPMRKIPFYSFSLRDWKKPKPISGLPLCLDSQVWVPVQSHAVLGIATGNPLLLTLPMSRQRCSRTMKFFEAVGVSNVALLPYTYKSSLHSYQACLDKWERYLFSGYMPSE